MSISLSSAAYPCIAAHRGSCGGNIPPNTAIAFEAAVKQGATILEADVARSADGVFFLFHTGNEASQLGLDKAFEATGSEELAALRLSNEFHNPTQYPLDRLESILEQFKGRCLINLDRCWQDWQEIVPIIERHHMREQIILKSPCKKEWIDKIQEVAPGYAYMPIISEDIEPFFAMGGGEIPGFSGAELVFSSERSPIIANHTAEKLRSSGKHAWGNGIQFSQQKVLSAGHNDDISIIDDPALGWGWLIDRGFDIIQTDWVALLNSYLTKRRFSG